MEVIHRKVIVNQSKIHQGIKTNNKEVEVGDIVKTVRNKIHLELEVELILDIPIKKKFKLNFLNFKKID